MDIILLFLLNMTVLLYGGFFVCVSCALNILLGAAIIFRGHKNNKIVIPYNLEMLGMIIIVAMYGVSNIWAVDKGIAIWGLFKYLPLLLFMIYMYQIDEEKKNKIIMYIPYMAAIMTIISFGLSFIPACRDLFLVNGRLSGFFQYPNTFAMFLLISAIIVLFKDVKKNYIDFVCILVCVLGIAVSKSLAVWCLCIVAVVYFVFLWLYKNKSRKFVIIGMSITCIVIISAAIVLGFSGGLNTIIDTSLKTSTFLGRFLYAYDSINVIKDHPFGLGYYGYYFMQGQYQTGVYSVSTVHNDLLQLILDIGIIPALLIFAIIIKQIISKKQSIRNKTIIVFMLLHTLFDYDMQFMIMGMILILLLPKGNAKAIKTKKTHEVVMLIVLAVITCFSVRIGASEVFGAYGDYEKALELYKGNTLSRIQCMNMEEDINKKVIMANEILSYNKSVPECFDAKAIYAYSSGKVDDIILYQEKAINLQQYNNARVEAYVAVLCECAEYFYEQGDLNSAAYCADNICKAIQELNELEDKTSKLGWMIQDKPVTILSDDIQEMVDTVLLYLQK